MKKLSVKDIVIIAMIGAVIGVLFTFMDGMYNPLSNLLGPILISITFGIYALSAILPGVLFNKPMAALLGAIFAAGINILTGSPYGIHIMVAGICQGLAVELAMFINKYRKFNIFTYILSSILIVVFVTTRDYFVFSFGALPFNIKIITVIIRILSTIVIGIVISKLVSSALKKVGLLSYE